MGVVTEKIEGNERPTDVTDPADDDDQLKFPEPSVVSA